MTPFRSIGFLVRTILRLLGSGLPIQSKVERPIITEEFIVFSLKNCRSFFKFHGIEPSLPITLFLERAAINTIDIYTAMGAGI